MVLPIKPICSANKMRKDGTSIIFFQYCYKPTNRTLLNSGIAIPINFWNKKQCCISEKLPTHFGNFEKLNDELNRQKRIAEDLIIHANKKQITNKGAFVKQTFSPSLNTDMIIVKAEETVALEVKDKKSKLDVYYQFDEYIKSKHRKVSKATLTVYRNVKSHLQAFEKHRKQKIAFNSFDLSFYEDFVDYLTFEHVHMRRQTILTGLRLNTIGKTIKHLRGFIKDRVKRKIISPIDLTDFKIPEEESDAIYLTHEEIGKIYQKGEFK